MKKKIVLSAVIPTHNSAKTINNLLQSINQSKFNNFKNIEVVVVDDRSDDQTVRIIKNTRPTLKFPIILIESNRKIGPAKARNLGVDKSSGKYVLFLDSDIILMKHTLKNAFSMAKEAKIKAFTGIWDWHQKTDKFFPQFKALRDWSYWTMERKKNYRYYLFSTRIAGIDKKLFKTVGKFNENYGGPTVEDIELTYKIEKAAKIEFSPKLIVQHEFEDFPIIAKKYFLRTRDWVHLYLKRYRFDPVATTEKEAIKPFILNFFLFFLVSLFVTRHIFTLFASILTLVIYLILEIRLIIFLYQKKGLLFAAKSVPTAMILYIIIEIGALYGFISYFFISRNSKD